MDLYNIPGDTGHPWRLNKFLEYQHKAQSIPENFVKVYAEWNTLSNDDRVFLTWLLTCTYNEITAILVFNLLDKTKTHNLDDFWRTHKPSLAFNSARLRVKSLDLFVGLLRDFLRVTGGNFEAWLKTFEGDYLGLEKALLGIKNVGRFSSELFLETITTFGIWDFVEPPIYSENWEQNSNLTSALFNVFYLDEKAEAFDKTGKLDARDKSDLNDMLACVKSAILRAYNDPNEVTLGVNKLCSFRNLFKGTRYGGFHHDRQLENLRGYERIYPEFSSLWAELYAIRRDNYDASLLGEVGGWNGVRKERKKLFLREGLTGVESIG